MWRNELVKSRFAYQVLKVFQSDANARGEDSMGQINIAKTGDPDHIAEPISDAGSGIAGRQRKARTPLMTPPSLP